MACCARPGLRVCVLSAPGRARYVCFARQYLLTINNIGYVMTLLDLYLGNVYVPYTIRSELISSIFTHPTYHNMMYFADAAGIRIICTYMNPEIMRVTVREAHIFRREAHNFRREAHNFRCEAHNLRREAQFRSPGIRIICMFLGPEYVHFAR